jgi:hypothetical protein
MIMPVLRRLTVASLAALSLASAALFCDYAWAQG